MSTNMMTAAFWILVGLSFLGIFAVLKYGITSGPNGGAVGAWLVVFPMFFMLGMGVVFQVTSSGALRAVCLWVAAIGFLAVAGIVSEVLVAEPRKRLQDAARSVRAESGVDIFPEPAQVEFLKAVAAHDVEKVKALLPAVGDLNKLYGDTTLFCFAVEREKAWEYEEDSEILEAMLKAGANPNVPAGRPLWAVHTHGADVVKLMLAAGADVNYKSVEGELFWWRWFVGAWFTDCVKLALAHGADLQARKDGVGAVARAAGGHSWESVVLLIEAGAPYKGEPAKEKGMTLYEFVKAEFDYRSLEGSKPEESLAKTMALLEAGKD
jgi:hypothetical protein